MEPGNMTLQAGRIFGLVLFKRRVTDQGVGPAGPRQLGAGAEKRFLVLFRIIEQDKELELELKVFFRSFKKLLNIIYI